MNLPAEGILEDQYHLNSHPKCKVPEINFEGCRFQAKVEMEQYPVYDLAVNMEKYWSLTPRSLTTVGCLCRKSKCLHPHTP